MRLIIALCIIVFAAPSFAADPPTPNYYPLAKGTKWHYRLCAEERELSVVCEIVEAEIRNGKIMARLEAKLPYGTLEEVISADAKGVYRNAILGARLQEPLTIIKYPIKARDGWKDKMKLGESDGTFAIAVKNIAAAIEVPAGKFTTLAIESTVELNGEKCAAVIWYADGIGIVKQEITTGNKVCTMELKSFSAPK